MTEPRIIVPPAPPPSSPGRQRAMQQQPAKDTAPELLLRRALHARGLRYRLHQRLLPDVRHKVDVVFGPARVAVEVRGCFWHACPIHGNKPVANAEWWNSKLGRNVQRDRQTEEALQEAGWQVVVVWEHEDMNAAADAIAVVVRERRR